MFTLSGMLRFYINNKVDLMSREVSVFVVGPGLVF